MRRASLLLGLFLLAAAWLGPLPELAHQAFFAHMILHMMIVAVATPLLAYALANGRFDPVKRFPNLFAPIPASILELLVVWAWHTPALHHAARHTLSGFIAEQSMFTAVGLLLWLSVLGGGGSLGGNRGGAGVVAMLLTSMHMTLLGALLALTPRPLYSHAHGFTALTPLGDQQLGGAIMIVIGGVTYLAGGLWLTRALLREQPANVEAHL